MAKQKKRIKRVNDECIHGNAPKIKLFCNLVFKSKEDETFHGQTDKDTGFTCIITPILQHYLVFISKLSDSKKPKEESATSFIYVTLGKLGWTSNHNKFTSWQAWKRLFVQPCSRGWKKSSIINMHSLIDHHSPPMLAKNWNRLWFVVHPTVHYGFLFQHIFSCKRPIELNNDIFPVPNLFPQTDSSLPSPPWASPFSLLSLVFEFWELFISWGCRGDPLVACWWESGKLRYVYTDMAARAVIAPQILVMPGLEWKRMNPPRRMTHVLNCPKTTWVVAEVALQ